MAPAARSSFHSYMMRDSAVQCSVAEWQAQRLLWDVGGRAAQREQLCWCWEMQLNMACTKQKKTRIINQEGATCSYETPRCTCNHPEIHASKNNNPIRLFVLLTLPIKLTSVTLQEKNDSVLCTSTPSVMVSNWKDNMLWKRWGGKQNSHISPMDGNDTDWKKQQLMAPTARKCQRQHWGPAA